MGCKQSRSSRWKACWLTKALQKWLVKDNMSPKVSILGTKSFYTGVSVIFITKEFIVSTLQTNLNDPMIVIIIIYLRK